MQMTFGMYLDGASWSEKPASVGELKVGPCGMLNLLETRAGLTGLTVHPAERINQYMQRLEACDGTDKWFHDSFEADSWSTAKQMLAWRDELIEAGWSGEADKAGSARLQSLAELEQTDLPLSVGRQDRLQQVLQRMQEMSSIAISRVYLHESFDLLPPVWKKVMNQLRHMGVAVEKADEDPPGTRSSNLTFIQTIFSGGTPNHEVSENDDSLLLVTATDEWEAAENLALWLAADTQANHDVTIICGTDTDVLDQALQRHGLPQLGASGSSRWRASLQVLPLVLANVWRPLDISRLVELLSLPLAPLHESDADYLLKAISKEPGVGGKAWKEALESIAESHKQKEKKKGKTITEEEAAGFTADLDEFLAGDRFDPETGIPEEKLNHRCQLVIDWLAKQVDSDPTLDEAISHAREMQKLAASKGTIPRVAIERMLDSVIGMGSSAPDRFRQAAAWQVVSHPGQITHPYKTVIWWGFIDQAAKPATYWSESEQESLKQGGIELEASRTLRSREAHAWRRGFNHARKHMLMFYPVSKHGEPVYHHPFWDEIRTAAVQAQPGRREDAIVRCLIRECAELQHEGQWQLAGRTTQLQKAEMAVQTAPTATHSIPKDVISPPRKLSYSQMSTMIGCPMMWALKSHAKLNAPAAQSIPSGNKMIGTLCHRIVEELYSEPGIRWKPEEAHIRSLELYDALVDSMAAELLLDGREIDNSRFREAVASAVRQLVEAITKRNLVVVGSENKLEGEFPGEVPFEGYADLLLRDEHGNMFILDLKWTYSSKRFKEELEEGSALQLATYVWLLKATSPEKQVHAGYFMLARGELLSDSNLLSEEAVESLRSMEEIWEMGSRSWSQRFEELNNGQLEASGVLARQIQIEKNLSKEKLQVELKRERYSAGLLYERPKCFFCDYARLCGAGGEL